MLQQNELDVLEKKVYVVNFEFENYKNDFYHAFDKFELKSVDISNDCLYIEVNNIKKKYI